MTGTWVPHDIRDLVVDFVRYWGRSTEIPINRFIAWLRISSSKYYDWQQRYGKTNEHNGAIPRDFWLEEWESRRLSTFIMSTRWKVTGA